MTIIVTDISCVFNNVRVTRTTSEICNPIATNDDFKNNYDQGEVITFVRDLYIPTIRNSLPFLLTVTREALDAQTRESKRIDVMKFQFDFALNRRQIRFKYRRTILFPHVKAYHFILTIVFESCERVIHLLH